MSNSSNIWSFQQLGGKDPKQLELAGYNAPFGRPRKDPVAKELIKSRVSTTNYPGRSGRPTRHSFGINWEPMELKGRWMTKMMTGTDTAQTVADNWRKFVEDEVACRISWGFIVSYIGYIEELELGRESEHHIAWRMKILIDKNEAQAWKAARAPTPSLEDLFTDWAELANNKILPPKFVLPNLNTDFLDQIDFAVRALATPSAILNRLAGQLADIEKATFAILGHFRGALKGFEQAFVEFRNLIMDTQIDAGNFARTAVSDINWIQYQLDLELHGNDIMALIAAMDRRAELAQKRQFTRFICARANNLEVSRPGGSDEIFDVVSQWESWESLSIRATGSVLAASAIREANGGGTHATAGETYLVP